jgi:SAM-dependent methyltransferase
MENEKLKYIGRDLEAMSIATNYYQWIVEEYKPYIGKYIAEVGAGTGNFSKFLINETNIKRLTAFEPSLDMYSILKKRFKDDNRVEPVNAFFRNTSNNQFKYTFDSIIYINVLEHIMDDEGELTFAYDTLKHKGHILIFVPALSGLYSQFDKTIGHIRRYSKQDLSILVQKSGFSIIKNKYFDIIGIIPWYIAFVLMKKILTSGNVSLYDRFIVPVTRKFENIITPPIGKNLLLVGKKS